MKILITAPSLDETENVSGISSVVRQIIARGNYRYAHFAAGSRDGERKNAEWFMRQAALPVRFLQKIKREKPDAAHVNTALNPLSIVRDFALVKAAKLARAPVLLHVHGGKFLAREFENRKLARIAEKMLRAADMVVVLSELEREIVEKRWPNLNARVLENAVAVEDFEIENVRKDEKTIVFLGRLHESKGLDEIVEAVKILKNKNLDFNFRAFGAGAGEEVFVREMRAALGERFFFGGVAAGKGKREELEKSGVFVLPSRYGEGLPMAMLEAMAARCIVIASEMASIGAVIKNGENGFLIEPHNAAQLVEKLELVLRGEIDSENIRKNARRTVAERFDLRDYIEKLEKFYAEIKNAKK